MKLGKVNRALVQKRDDVLFPGVDEDAHRPDRRIKNLPDPARLIPVYAVTRIREDKPGKIRPDRIHGPRILLRHQSADLHRRPPAAQFTDLGCPVVRAHQRLSHKHRVRAHRFRSRHIRASPDAALRHEKHALRHQRPQFASVSDIHREILQIPVVDADDPGSGLQGCLNFPLVMRLHQRAETDCLRRLEIIAKLEGIKNGHNQQHRVRSESLRLVDHIFVHREILPENREIRRFPDGRQIFVPPEKPVRFREA